MTLNAPVTDLDPRFSSEGATAVPWPVAETHLQNAGVFWLSTVGPEGRPHVAPLIGVWLDGNFYFSTGEGERKAKNLAQNARVAVTTGCNSLTEELDIVIEGKAAVVTDDEKRRRVGDAHAAKYGEGWRLVGLDGVVLFEVSPTKAFGFGRQDGTSPPPAGGFSQTRWRFQTVNE